MIDFSWDPGMEKGPAHLQTTSQCQLKITIWAASTQEFQIYTHAFSKLPLFLNYRFVAILGQFFIKIVIEKYLEINLKILAYSFFSQKFEVNFLFQWKFDNAIIKTRNFWRKFHYNEEFDRIITVNIEFIRVLNRFYTNYFLMTSQIFIKTTFYLSNWVEITLKMAHSGNFPNRLIVFNRLHSNLKLFWPTVLENRATNKSRQFLSTLWAKMMNFWPIYFQFSV